MNIVRANRKPTPQSIPSISRTKVFAAPWQSPFAFVTATGQYFVTLPSSIDTYGLDRAIDGGVELMSA